MIAQGASAEPPHHAPAIGRRGSLDVLARQSLLPRAAFAHAEAASPAQRALGYGVAHRPASKVPSRGHAHRPSLPCRDITSERFSPTRRSARLRLMTLRFRARCRLITYSEREMPSSRLYARLR